MRKNNRNIIIKNIFQSEPQTDKKLLGKNSRLILYETVNVYQTATKEETERI